MAPLTRASELKLRSLEQPLVPRVLASGEPIRVLVVDDSALMRRIVSGVLTGDAGIEVIGFASNGVLALQRVEQWRPDVVVLDLEMPEMGGLEALQQIKARHPATCVIICSAISAPGAAITIEALSLGADDYVLKVVDRDAGDTAQAALRSQLVSKIKQFFRTPIGSSKPSAPSLNKITLPLRPRSAKRAELVVIGCSTGGPSALSAILPAFPASFPAPVVVVQHMPPMFTRLLAARLDLICPLTVEEAADGSELRPGKVLIAPGDYHLRLQRKGMKVSTVLDQGPSENSCRPAVDVLFRSAAETFAGATVAVILTGMGSDGVRGAHLLKQQGACVIAQDEETSVVWGMPGQAVREGLADSVVPLSRIVPEILKNF